MESKSSWNDSHLAELPAASRPLSQHRRGRSFFGPRGVVLLAVVAFAGQPREVEAQLGAKIGLGTGLPYGGVFVGAGGEVELFGHVALLGGVGVGTSDSPWAYGARLYFQKPTRRWRPHVSFLHWTEGNGYYLGLDQDVGNPGGFVLSYGVGFGDVNLEANVGALLGVGYRW